MKHFQTSIRGSPCSELDAGMQKTAAAVLLDAISSAGIMELRMSRPNRPAVPLA